MPKNNHVYLKNKTDQRELFLRVVSRLENRKQIIDGKYFNSRLSDYLNSEKYLIAAWKIFNKDMIDFQEKKLKNPKKFYEFTFSIKNDIRHKWDNEELEKVLDFAGIKSDYFQIETEPYSFKLSTKFDNLVNTCWNFYFSGDLIRESSDYISPNMLFVSRGVLFFNEYYKASLLIYDFFSEKLFFFEGSLQEESDENYFCFKFESAASQIKLELNLSNDSTNDLYCGYLKRSKPLILVKCCIEQATKPYYKSTILGYEYRNTLPMQNYYVPKHIEEIFDTQNTIKLNLENFIVQEQKDTIKWLQAKKDESGMVIRMHGSSAGRVGETLRESFLKSKNVPLEYLKQQKAGSSLDVNEEILKRLIGLTILREDLD